MKIDNRVKHGMYQSRLYSCWEGMKRRARLREDCKIYPPWDAFIPFMEWSLANGYKEDLVLCREGDSGNYEPNNVRWDTHINNVKEAFSCNWKVISPEGVSQEIHNLSEFCKVNDLNPSHMASIGRGSVVRKTHKGWKCIKLI